MPENSPIARIRDISTPLGASTPTWPGSRGVRLEWTDRIEAGAAANVSFLSLDVHTGTHVDAPLHGLGDGDPVERLPLEVFLGPADVVEVTATRAITAAVLEDAVPGDAASRLLLRTQNSLEWALADQNFRPGYAALTRDGAAWIVDREIRLVGIDYLSIQLYEDDFETHRILLGAGVAVLEGVDLAALPPGRYDLVCLPLLVEGAEATPVRAALVTPDAP